MLPRKPTRVIATPQDQDVGLGDNHQFVLLLHRGLRCPCEQQAELQTAQKTNGDFQISTRLRRVRGKGVKEISCKFWPDENRTSGYGRSVGWRRDRRNGRPTHDRRTPRHATHGDLHDFQGKVF